MYRLMLLSIIIFIIGGGHLILCSLYEHLGQSDDSFDHYIRQHWKIVGEECTHLLQNDLHRIHKGYLSVEIGGAQFFDDLFFVFVCQAKINWSQKFIKKDWIL